MPSIDPRIVREEIDRTVEENLETIQSIFLEFNRQFFATAETTPQGTRFQQQGRLDVTIPVMPQQTSSKGSIR